MDFKELQNLLADWYDVAPEALGLSHGQIPTWLNPVLTDFYLRFGALAESPSRFGSPASSGSALTCQDHVIPVGELKSKNGYTAFCYENQGVFIVAANDDPADASTYAQGDAVLPDRTVEMTDTGVPLTECIVTTVLRETIMSVHDRYRLITPDSLKAALKLAKTGQTVNSRYIWPDNYCTFYLAKDVWFMDWDDMQFAAHRGLWKQKQPTYRRQVFEGGGGWTSRPENPTFIQRAKRALPWLFKH